MYCFSEGFGCFSIPLNEWILKYQIMLWYRNNEKWNDRLVLGFWLPLVSLLLNQNSNLQLLSSY